MIVLLFVGCFKPKARHPVTYTSGRDQSTSIAFNKKLYELESKRIESYIKKDSLNVYQNSKLGFWYAITNDIKDDIFPEKGDKVTFDYAVYDFDGHLLYAKEDLGRQSYYIEQQEMIQGLQAGIQFLNKGEKVIFLFPSHMAYGYYGDRNKIGANTPIIITLELIDINKKNIKP